MALMTSEGQYELMARLLLDVAPIAPMPCCMRCGSVKHIEWHHVFGRNNDPEFLASEKGHVVPLCRPCHRGRWGIHRALDQAKVNLGYTPDRIDRGRRARKAWLVFLWWLDEQLEPDHQQSA